MAAALSVPILFLIGFSTILGYYAYGASAGREWYLNPSLQFKDDSINDADLTLLNNVFDRVGYTDTKFFISTNCVHLSMHLLVLQLQCVGMN